MSEGMGAPVVDVVVAGDTIPSVAVGLKGEGRSDESDRAQGENPRPPGPGLIFGEAFAEMGRNLRDNLAADRVRIFEGVWRRA
ncbi:MULTISPECIES: hypothetical protein [unclassified Halomonas]|uniref:hypothetical protein n=1 Tax=unclassified Halomonas TaxID=2609666 RepID=UPI0024690590|nr:MULTISPECIES: hypothetical protein [unclassified Halomonas]